MNDECKVEWLQEPKKLIIDLTYNHKQSELVLDNYTICLHKKFNWFQRLMYKTCFGIEARNIKTIHND